MTLSKEDTEDILQETFISVFKNLYKYNSSWKITTWLYKIAVNVNKNVNKADKSVNTSMAQIVRKIKKFRRIKAGLKSCKGDVGLMARRRKKYGFSFSWKRATGISGMKQKIARKTGIPTTKTGRQQKIGRIVTGGGCLVSIIGFIAVLFTIILIFT
ncbi:sigma factor [Acetivibrio saccincola]|uniref:RNA polymerase sigma factor n=1 Tax=Acetivibrio saccincola TaxID=1677857 RepID=A0A2K9E5M0_9FIRM|nr:sigma factor [Acetivibrio saccincola]AUG59022.1 RNA polymerase sigma factor RpoE [Acetivibrio saccincola]